MQYCVCHCLTPARFTIPSDRHRCRYLSDYAGNGSHGTIVPGTPASSSPIGAVSDIDTDPAGNVYLFNKWNQIVRVDNGVVGQVVYDNGISNPAARFDLAVVNIDLLYFVNYIDRRVYQIVGSTKSDFVTDNTVFDPTEPYDRFHYPINGPSSSTYTDPYTTDSLIFADTDNDRIMRVSFLDGYIHFVVGNATGGAPFYEGIDPLAMAPARPRVVDSNPITGKIFFVEYESNRVLHIDSAGLVDL